MGAAAGLTFIDTSVFVIDLRYKRDKLFGVNRSFLERVAGERSGVTSIFNLLEVCGILSFNLNEKQLRELFHYFSQRYHVEVLPHANLESSLPPLKTGDVFRIISKRSALGDALIIGAIEKHVPGVARFVSWDAGHFTDRLSIPCLTPKQLPG